MDGLLFVVFLFFCLAYYSWGNKRISQSRKATQKEFSNLEVRYELSDYKCYTYNHPEVWGEVDYLVYKTEIISSARWRFSVNHIPWPQKTVNFCLNIDTHNKEIYLVRGYKTFDWDKLQHYEQWLESKKEMAERIAKYKANNK